MLAARYAPLANTPEITAFKSAVAALVVAVLDCVKAALAYTPADIEFWPPVLAKANAALAYVPAELAAMNDALAYTPAELAATNAALALVSW